MNSSTAKAVFFTVLQARGALDSNPAGALRGDCASRSRRRTTGGGTGGGDQNCQPGPSCLAHQRATKSTRSPVESDEMADDEGTPRHGPAPIEPGQLGAV